MGVQLAAENAKVWQRSGGAAPRYGRGRGRLCLSAMRRGLGYTNETALLGTGKRKSVVSGAKHFVSQKKNLPYKGFNKPDPIWLGANPLPRSGSRCSTCLGTSHRSY